jgi:AcrR family transcriptional regulator
MNAPDPSASSDPGHRGRLLQAMASVAASKGFADVTIADVVRQAGVSKRTFYENFESKDACFLALYRAASASALRTLSAALVPDKPWQTQVEHALGTYFAHLAAGPALVRTLFVEIHQLGPEGMRVRREVLSHIADFILATVNGNPADHSEPKATVLTPTMALAAVGAINELVLQAIESDQVANLEAMTASAGEVVRALTRARTQNI